jgi:sensor c-di-GMP phosphodiesterase-like protein
MQSLKAAPKSIKTLIVVIALTAIVAPAVFALYVAWIHGQAAEMEKVLAYAKDVQLRTDSTADQIAQGIKRLQDAHLADPCSDESLAIMRDIDISSSYIQAIGHVANGNFECSSLGRSGSGWSLGPIDFISSRGVAFRDNVKIPFTSNSIFTVIEQNGYAAIINKRLPVDATAAEPDVSLATFSLDNHRVIAARGKIQPEWINELRDQKQVTLFKEGYVVAVVASASYRTGSLAALPASYIDRQTREMALVLVPIGLIAGLMFAFATFYLARIQVSMPALLKAGLKRDELFLLYQPVVNLQTGACIGAEALLRWRRPGGEMVSPDIFIPVAESTGLIQKITQRVIKLASQDAANLFDKHPEFHLAINLAADDLHSNHTIELLHHFIRDTGANPRNLIVEATERGLMKADIAKKIIAEIRSHGFGMAIDDFGTGYSSLSYIESFEIDFLKIDKSFVDKIATDAPTSFVVLHIIEMAKKLNMKMVAEGVETEVQAQFLRDHGVQYAQGWLYGKPMSMTELVHTLGAHANAG